MTTFGYNRPLISGRFFLAAAVLLSAYFFSLPCIGAAVGPSQRAVALDSLPPDRLPFLEPAPTFNKSRFYTAAGTGTVIYGGFAYALYQTWYADFPTTNLHSFDDSGEWMQMDKAGHFFTTYMESRFLWAGARWTGMSRPAARWTAVGLASILQGTVEIMDGFSSQWGFSWSDLAANTAGAGLFAGQDILWGEQRILLKVSNNLAGHPDDIIITNNQGETGSLGYISRERYGQGTIERFLKDYNNMTVWASVNVDAFAPDLKLPPYLNVAVGYGAQDVYGAYGNTWTEGGRRFNYTQPRYRQFFLSPDIDFTRIPTRKRGVKLALGVLNFLKVPAPALEYNTLGEVKWHWLMW